MCAFFKRIPWHYVCIRKVFFSYVRKMQKMGVLLFHLLFLGKLLEEISDLLKNQCQAKVESGSNQVIWSIASVVQYFESSSSKISSFYGIFL